MATVNLGSIKFKWKGTYAGGTAYTIDDVVSYNGSSYICIQASTGNLPTNATYFEQMSQKGSDGTNGTNGTDLTTTLTTQGDIVYRNASGLARLGAGTAGQALITNGTGANPSWGDTGGGLLQIKRATYTSEGTFNSTSGYAQFGTLQVTITPTASNSSFWINATAYAAPSNHDTPWKYNISDSQVGTTTPIFTDVSRNISHLGGTAHFGVSGWGANSTVDEYWIPQHTIGGMYTPASNNGSARTFRLLAWNSNNGTLILNRTQVGGGSQSSGGVSTIEVWEIANGIYS
ncbi:hypothetical protein Eistla_gp2 [Pelagibacter phage Eistla EXVC025P]|nr:hypothetical protein Eistla_gp2 [Pelagibacter phage Eistla EXVC025P]